MSRTHGAYSPKHLSQFDIFRYSVVTVDPSTQIVAFLWMPAEQMSITESQTEAKQHSVSEVVISKSVDEH